jgi:hypothetical protein
MQVTPYHIDGVKYMEHVTPSDFSGKIQAFTYPDELDALLGVATAKSTTLEAGILPGVFLHDQPPKPFDLAYRTTVGNDVDGLDHAYKLHILYNLLAVPTDRQYSTISETVAPMLFEWSISATPERMYGIRPTAHLSIDSRLDPGRLSIVESILYGDDFADTELPPRQPYLPSLVDLIELIDTQIFVP